MTDDQGYGDFGATGNPIIETPHIDALAAQSVWMTNFYVSPVCSPTRASLMTGRYNYRTRVVDTFLGRSMMDPDETTIAELLRNAGYATGIFGKWHLGDNYPLRAMDQGFEESLVIRGGGLAQPADPLGNERRYTDPILAHNGALEKAKGYCTDVFFDAAIDWIKKSWDAGKPFFAYIAPNAPHDPLHDVPEELRKRYAEMGSDYKLNPLVGRYLKASSDTYVWVTQTKDAEDREDEQDRYVLIYSQDKKKAVLLAVPVEFPSNPTDDDGFGPGIRDIGFATADGNGEWDLYNTEPDPETGQLYESQGGIGLMREFSSQLAKGLTQKLQRVPFKEISHFVTGREAYGLSQLLPNKPGQASAAQIDSLSRIGAMITNIDDNVGKLMAFLEQAKLRENTLIIFLSDNGPAGARFNGPFRGQKGEVYEGGVRVPFWMSWPGHLKPGYKRDEVMAHIDVMPTILVACGVFAPESLKIDGWSFWNVATGESGPLPPRPLVIQTHRGDVPAARHQFMIREGDWKLLHASGFGRESFTGTPHYELYKISEDPGEIKDLAAQQPDLVNQLLSKYDAWFSIVSNTRPDNYAPPRIHLGTPHENPATLTRQDWRGGTWADDSIGFWLVTLEGGRYDITAHFTPKNEAGEVELRVGETLRKAPIAPGAGACRFDDVELAKGDAEFHAVIRHDNAARGVYQVEVRRN